MKRFRTILCEADGSYSATRFCLVLSTVVILTVWVVFCGVKKAIQDIPQGPVEVIALLSGLKWAQLKHESDGPP